MKKKKDINKLHEEKLKKRKMRLEPSIEDPDIINVEAKARKKKVIAFVIIGLVLIIAAVSILVIFKLREIKEYSSYQIISESETPGTYTDRLGENIIHYSKNGVYAVNIEGQNKWDRGFLMNNPTYVYTEPYGLFYDKEGTLVELFDSNGLVVSYNLPQEITMGDVSSYGVGAFLIQSGTSGTVVFYDKTGRKLDIEVKNVLAESSGYPLSMTLSPSGNGLVLSLVFLDQGSMKTRISFLNFDVGKDKVDRVVGFYEYEDILFPEVDYIGSDTVVAFGDGKMVFYSLKNPASPTVLKEIGFSEEVLSVMTGEKMAAVILKSEEGGNKLIIYDSMGVETLKYNFDFEYTKAKISEDYVMIFGGQKTLITSDSHIKFNGEFDGIVSAMTAINDTRFLQYGAFGSRIVELK